jgi:hypothetical protein
MYLLLPQHSNPEHCACDTRAADILNPSLIFVVKEMMVCAKWLLQSGGISGGGSKSFTKKAIHYLKDKHILAGKPEERDEWILNAHYVDFWSEWPWLYLLKINVSITNRTIILRLQNLKSSNNKTTKLQGQYVSFFYYYLCIWLKIAE